MADPATLSAAINAFTLHIYRAVLKSKQPENMFFSPLSLAMALSMTYLGAKEKTADEIKAALKVANIPDEELHNGFRKLSKMMDTSQGRAYVLKMANKIYAHQDHKFLGSFMEAAMFHYQAAPEMVDFAGNTESTRQTINQWVEDQTASRIKDLLAPDTINALTKMVLVNAIYFKGDWAIKFNPEHTNKDTFMVTEKEHIMVNLMFKNDKFPFAWSPELNCKAVELPYINHELSMVLIQSAKQHDLATLESRITPERLAKLLGSLKETTVMIHLPKFKVEHQVNMKPILQSLGMEALFNQGGANLSGIDGTNQLFVSEVVHKAFIEVNEEGSEAAAATAAAANFFCMPPHFLGNYPFLFLIRDRRSGVVLFMGRMARPDAA